MMFFIVIQHQKAALVVVDYSTTELSTVSVQSSCTRVATSCITALGHSTTHLHTGIDNADVGESNTITSLQGHHTSRFVYKHTHIHILSIFLLYYTIMYYTYSVVTSTILYTILYYLYRSPLACNLDARVLPLPSQLFKQSTRSSSL